MDGEGERLAELRRYDVLDTPPEPEYDRLTVLAARLLEAPIAIITFLDETRQWFKSRYGLSIESTPRPIAFCDHTIESDEAFVVDDAAKDPRFRENPLVTGGIGVRAYAGVPLITPRRHRVGTIAVVDTRPRSFGAVQLQILHALAEIVVDELEKRLATGPRLFRETDVRLAALVSQLPAIVWTVDRDLRITSMMGAGLRGLGMRENQLAGTLLADYFGGSSAARVAMGAHEAALAGESMTFAFAWSGNHYRCHVEPLRDTQERVVGTLGLSLDISEQRRAEEELRHSLVALRETEERYRLIARATNDAIWDWDLTSGAISRSEAFHSVFGYRADQIEPTLAWWEERVVAADRARIVGEVKQLLAAGVESWSFDYRFTRSDGGVAEVLDRGFVVRDAGGKATRVVGAMTDVTARNRMQARLLQSDRLASVGTLAAGVAHEINNPLSYVVANVAYAVTVLERLRVAHPTDVELLNVNDALVDAGRGSERVRRIVADLRVFARGDDERRERVNVHKAVRAAVELTRHRVQHAAVLELDLSSVPPVWAIESRLVQVLINLLVNAADAIGAGQAREHRIVVSARAPADGLVTIAVSDTGPGIPADILPHIFDPFFTTKPVGVGTGLGLAICHGIVESLGGRIEIESTGRGTTVRVVLPAAPPHPSAPAPSVAATSDAPRLRARILIIDDEPSVLAALQRLLGPDHDVAVEDNLAPALRRLEAGEAFDVVLCDLMMPSSSGAELMAGLRRVRPELERRVVFMSGGAFTPEARAFVLTLTRPLLEKPIEAKHLRSVIDEVARSSK